MKPIVALIAIALCGAAGYWLEPSIRPGLISQVKPADAKPDDKPAAAGSSEPVTSPVPKPPVVAADPVAPAVPDWVAGLTPEQLPEKVTLKEKVGFQVAGSSDPMVMPAGAPVTPVRMEEGQLVVSPFGGPIEGRVAVSSTDLVERLGNQPPAVEPPAVAVNPGEPAPEPMPEPEPEPEPAPAPAGAELDAEQIVGLMQESIRSGKINEFKFDQVLGWKAGEKEERDGQNYQTGLVSYKAETIFGVKTIQAQALIQDGKIVRWIWPKSGMEIR